VEKMVIFGQHRSAEQMLGELTSSFERLGYNARRLSNFLVPPPSCNSQHYLYHVDSDKPPAASCDVDSLTFPQVYMSFNYFDSPQLLRQNKKELS
jgi:hypothetical protein